MAGRPVLCGPSGSARGPDYGNAPLRRAAGNPAPPDQGADQAGQAGGRWVYEAFANRWKSDHGSVLCAGLRIPVIPVKVDREQQWADFTIASREERRQPEKTASPRQKGEAHARPQAAEPLTAHARRRKRPHAGVKSGSPCSRIKSVFFHQNFLEANCTFHV